MKFFSAYTKLFSVLLSVYFLTTTVSAATLQLTKIGTVDTAGAAPSTWTYSTPNPIFRGLGTPNSQGQIMVDTKTSTFNIDSDGAWLFVNTDLSAGAHNIKISSNGEEYAFTITIGSGTAAGTTTPPASSTPQSTVGVPETGSEQFFAFVIGFYLILGGAFLAWKSFLKPQFDKNFLKEL